MDLKRIGLFCLLWLSSWHLTHAQERGRTEGGGPGGRPQGTISGVVMDETEANILQYATVSLMRKRDSMLVTGSITDTDGKFKLSAPAGRYFLKLEYISCHPKIIDPIRLGRNNLSMDLGSLSLQQNTSMLKEVEVTAEKSRLEIGLDKKIFNVGKDLSNIGGSATEALENIPSVIVDMEGNISLRGSDNVRILIDGKPSGLMGISPATALEQIPANTIERIEVITNPSVRYDAEGMAGIINIVLNKQKKAGLNALGTVTVSYPQRHSATVSFNSRSKKINIFGTAGANYRESPGLVNYNRETYLNDSTYFLDQEGNFVRGGSSYHAKIGMDYFLNDKTSLTLSSGISPSTHSNTRNTDYYGYNMAGNISDDYFRETKETESALSMDHTASFTKEFNQKKQVLKADINYSKGEGNGTMDMTETYDIKDYSTYDNDELMQRTNDLQEQENLTFQTDYAHPMGKAGIIELGLKSSLRRIDLDYDVEELDDLSNEWINLSRVSNHFKYNEAIHAAYGLMGNQHGTFQYQVGIRVEQTLVSSLLEDTGEKNDKNYIHAFPSLHLSNEFGGGNEVQLSYSKRIKRPSYRNLNPFNSYADPLNLWIGNPELNPELTHSMELTHIKYWKRSFISSGIYYRHTDSVMQRIRKLDSMGISTTRPENLSQSHSYGIELSFSQQLFQWWKINGSFNYFRRITDGRNLDEMYRSDAYSWSGRVNSQMTFWKDLQLQWMFNYRGPRETTQGTRSAMYFFDVGIKKEVFDQKGSVSLKVRDVFNSRIYDMETFGPNFYIHSQYQRSPRMVFASFSYKVNDYRSRKKRQRGQNYEMEDMGM